MKHVFANWKMYLTHKESVTLAKQLAEQTVSESVHVAIFPTALSITEVRGILPKSIDLGAQNLSNAPAQGAYTGALSAELLKEAGTKYALVGHSERRHVFQETNEEIEKKIEHCATSGIIPVLCVGETKEDMQEEKGQYRLKKQLQSGLRSFNGEKVFIAYEPVWAISQSGKEEPCDPIRAADIATWIKEEVSSYTNAEVAVLYGGSVSSKNVVSYMEKEAIDGVLIGHASTQFSELQSILTQLEL